MIDPKLKTVLSVAETLNITKSAKLLSLTQPSVSQHIKAVEETLGVKLFVRTNRGLKVTAEGQIVIEYAKKMRGLYGVLLKQLEDQKRSVQHLTVGVTPTAESNAISQVLALYSAQNPSIRITIITDTINNLYQRMELYELDLAGEEDRVFDVEYEGHVNRIEIRDHRIRVLEADCPDQLCVHQKAISRNHESIICLPNQVVAEVESAESSEYDAVAQ